MYNLQFYQQLIFSDFNPSVGLKMNPENRWIKKSGSYSLGRARKEIG